MSYELPNKPQSPKRLNKAGGSGLVLVIIVVVGAMILFSGQRGGSNDELIRPADGGPANGSTDEYGNARSTVDTGSGDWSIDEVPTKNDKQFETAPGPINKEPVNKSTAKGDWEIEEVDTSGKNADDVELKLNNPKQSGGTTEKSTESGDWKIEEVDKDKRDK